MGWTYYNSIYEFQQEYPQIHNSAWVGHCNFAYDLVRFMKPNKIVELGTHYGCSFFSFCQAIKDANLSTKCFAVDTWQGDSHSGHYGNEVYSTVSSVLNKYFINIGEMHRTSFDEALGLFEDGSIDLLHIDGYHTFEAASHDFTTWLPKLANNGVILFHDITAFHADFGVYKLWDSLKQQYPYLEFVHSYGLGVLFPKGYNENFQSIFPKANELKSTYER